MCKLLKHRTASGVQFSIFTPDLMPAYYASNVPFTFLFAKIYGKTVLNEEIPVNKYQKKIFIIYVKVGRNNVHYVKVLKLWVTL